ncbi:MAG: phosphoglucosamine mutase [Candidatus Marinimicrobia bacterium]|nr:phosphoglucosamine mutase [Candidatus Neomarinimicrobiota bacterium]
MIKESISGIRAYEHDFTEELISKYIESFRCILDPCKVIIGRDSRKSGIKISKIVKKYLASQGVHVLDAGICPTPTIEFLTKELGYDGGIVITASHNPLPWNGLKFINADGTFLNKAQMEKLLKLKRTIEIKREGTKSAEIIEDNKIRRRHVEYILELKPIDIELIRKKNFRVVIDAVNGACSETAPELLTEIGCDTIEINCDPTKPFPRNPEPLVENLKELSEKVKESNADIGFAIDPDGDRLAVVSNEGLPIGEEYTVVMGIELILSKCSDNSKKNVVVNLSTTQLADIVVKKYNGNIFRSSVGEINVVELMKKVNAIIGGEGNGGIIYPECHYGRDSLVGIVLILQMLAERNINISEYVNSLPKFYMIKDKIKIKNKDLQNVHKKLENVKNLLKPDSIDFTDGIKLLWKNYWLHIRPSNTEPIIRIYSEADNMGFARELVEKIKDLLKNE